MITLREINLLEDNNEEVRTIMPKKGENIGFFNHTRREINKIILLYNNYKETAEHNEQFLIIKDNIQKYIIDSHNEFMRYGYANINFSVVQDTTDLISELYLQQELLLETLNKNFTFFDKRQFDDDDFGNYLQNDILEVHCNRVEYLKQIYLEVILAYRIQWEKRRTEEQGDLNTNLISGLQVENEALKADNSSLKESIQALKKELQIKQKTLVQLDSGGTVEKLQAQIEKLKDRNKELETENEVLENQLAEYAGKIEGYEEELQAQTQTSAFIDNLKM